MNVNDKIIYNDKEAFVKEVVKVDGVVTRVLVMYWKPKYNRWGTVWTDAINTKVVEG